MSEIKTRQTASNKIGEIAKQSGFLLMAAAATLGMLEVPDHPSRQVIMLQQPVFSMASSGVDDMGQANQLRRERDEAAPHYMSYSVAQRTPSRSGKH